MNDNQNVYECSITENGRFSSKRNQSTKNKTCIDVFKSELYVNALDVCRRIRNDLLIAAIVVVVCFVQICELIYDMCGFICKLFTCQ